MKLAQYYFVSGDEQTWNVLDNWLNWLDTYGVEESAGYFAGEGHFIEPWFEE